MQMEMEMEMRRGEMVWARVVYPHQWWPGLVLRRDIFGVLVSFFGCHKSRYFLESEISPFEPNFKSHIKNCTDNTLLDCALRFLGQQIASALTFHGQGQEKRRPSPSNLIQPQMVVGFVRSVAVSSWVDDVDFVSAVHVFAQMTAFRRYSLKSSVHSRMRDDQSSVEIINSINGELDTLETRDDCRVFSEQEEKTALPLIPCMESPVNRLLKRQLDQSAVSERPLKLFKTLPLSINRSDAFLWRIREGCDAALPDIFISRKAFSGLFEFFSNMAFSFNGSHDCPQRNISKCEAYLYHFLMSVKLKNQKLSSIVAQSLTSTSPSNLMDLVDMLNFFPVKTTSRFSDIDGMCMAQEWDENVETLNNSETCISSANIQQPQETEAIPEDDGRCISYTHDATENMLELSAVLSLSNYAVGIHGNEDDVGDEVAGARKYLSHCHCTADELKMPSSNGDSSTSVKINGPVSVNEALGDSSKESKELGQPVTSDLALKSEIGEQSEFQTTITFSKCLCMKFPRDCILPSKDELLKKFSPFGSVDSERTKVYFYTGSARVVFLHQLDAMAAYQYAQRKKIVFGKDNVKFWLDPMEDKKEPKSLVPFGQPVTSDLALKPEIGNQSEFQTTITFSKSLCMKFPRDYILPSKDELLEKFSPFGSVDSERTKVYFYTGSARVVFLHQVDAVAAYQYAKRKKILFGKENVKFWLDPLEDKTGTKSPVPFEQPVTFDLALKSEIREQLEFQTTVTFSKSLCMKFPRDCILPSKDELLEKFSLFGSVDSQKTKVHTGSARVVFFHLVDAMAAYQLAKRKKIVFGKDGVKFWLAPLEDKKEPKSLAPFGQPPTSDLALKSEIGEQSEFQTTIAFSKSLCMKFPRDCILPSKAELLEKFSPFGSVVSERTKVYTGSARVVFLHQVDAMAAYQYAKRKKILFGKDNIKFWLDTLEDKSEPKSLIPFRPCTTKLQGLNLKPCLKRSSPLEKEDKRPSRKVRFLIET